MTVTARPLTAIPEAVLPLARVREHVRVAADDATDTALLTAYRAAALDWVA